MSARKVLVLRTCRADMTAHEGFVWPERGPVEAPDWDPTPECGHGLHGLLWGCGDATTLTYPDGKWLVVEVNEWAIVDLSGKVKFRRGTVLFCGARHDAIAYLDAHGAADKPVVYSTRTAGDRGSATAGDDGTATAGYGGTATAGDRGSATARYDGSATAGNYGTATAGYYGTATAGDYGSATAGNYGTATAGNYGTATAGDRGSATAGNCGTATAGNRGSATAGNCGTATAGNRGSATAGNCGTATAGNYGTATAGYYGTATAGDYGSATAGDGGELRIRWLDGIRYRLAVGYVGEDGIEAGVAYRVEAGKLVKREAR